jgi:serine/threonine-protein kinase
MPRLIEDLAAAVVDGSPVDWAAAESTADPDSHRLVRHLRTVEAVANVHRDAASSEAHATPVAENRSASRTSWGHLQILERIGGGAFGDVYRARDPRLDRDVALKLIRTAPSADTAARSAIIDEGRLLARIRHPNVVTIHGAEQIGDQIGLWMELVAGRSLEELLQEHGTVTPAEVIRIGLELAGAVEAVHRAGLLHRDIKAQNVMRADDGRVVLMDFGTGREVDDTASPDLTGTPLYLAPEVLAGGPATVESDVYSLGVLLYHLLTRSYPVRGQTVRDVRRAHEHKQRIAIRTARTSVRRGLARVIERACDPRPDHRYASAKALASDLDALRHRPAVTRRWAGLAAAAVLLAFLLRPQAPPSAPVDNPVIVVLPLRNLGGEPGSDLLVDSLTAGLVSQLAIIDGLQVKSQTTSFMLKNWAGDLADLGKRLGVNLAVEGSAQRTGDTLVVHAALVSVAGGDTVWSEPVDRELRTEADVTAVVEELTRTIVNRLRLQLGPTQRRYDNVDIETYETYLRARTLRDERGRPTRDAIPLFERVLARDPSYAKALAALAATYGYLGLHYPDADGIYMPQPEAAALAEPLALRALDIDPMLAEAHAAMGYVHAFSQRWTRAETSFRRAIELEPSLTTVYGDFVLSTLIPWGRVDEAVATMQTALDADPLSLDLRRILANAQLSAGLFDEALANCEYILAERPDFPFVALFRARALLFGGRKQEALDWFHEFAVGRPGVMGWIHAIEGRREEAERIAAQFDHLPVRQAEIFGLLGDHDRALDALERLALLNPGRAGHELTRPEMAKLRADPRAEAFRRRLGFPPR